MRRRCARKRTRRGLVASTSNAERKVLPVPVAETNRARVSPLRWITPRASKGALLHFIGLDFFEVVRGWANGRLERRFRFGL